MRIIAGEFKGRTLDSPAWPGLRPTSDRLRETLFNVLAPVVRGARFLDGYAGTGAVGIEALSRGAAHVTFVEQDARAAGLITANLSRCGTADRHAIIRVGFARAAASARPVPFDIIFLDPPYGSATLIEALDAAAPLVRAETRLVIEHARRDEAPATHAGLARARLLRSGDSVLSFYRRADSDGFAEPDHGRQA
jgi:16S rRNA (guanine(966)-N(2))-methyltransferase RsmD